MTADDVEIAKLSAVIGRRYSADTCCACHFFAELSVR